MHFEAILKNPAGLRAQVVERLGAGQVDFVEQMNLIGEKRAGGREYRPSGVLVPLEFDSSEGEYVVILNKRSTYVQQAGDLCFPGGRTDRRFDGLLSRLLAWGILTAKASSPLRKLLQSSAEERRIFLLILASVLRESWEEMRLPPWRVEYLGSLPVLRMQSFPRVIFPVVGRIRSKWKARPNWEVERILRVPLRAFYDPENYAICQFLAGDASEGSQEINPWEYPCLVVREAGREEILWGATFRILMTFLQRVFEFPVEQIQPPRRVCKVLPPHYFTGKARGRRSRRSSRATNESAPKPR